MLFMMVRHAQKVKGEAENLNPSIAPRGHRVRRGNPCIKGCIDLVCL